MQADPSTFRHPRSASLYTRRIDNASHNPGTVGAGHNFTLSTASTLFHQKCGLWYERYPKALDTESSTSKYWHLHFCSDRINLYLTYKLEHIAEHSITRVSEVLPWNISSNHTEYCEAV